MKDIVAILSPHAAGHDRLGELLAVSAGRVLLKVAKRGENWCSQVNEEQIRHIADWLRAALVNNEAWLDNVDDQGRPKKLMKFGSIGQMVQEADKAMLRAAQQLSAAQPTEGDEELFAELEDGFLLVRLMTPAALDRESAEMQHCIGNGGYDENLQNGNLVYLSLRDRFGKAHATLEVAVGTITQIQGKQNLPPIQAYLDRLIPFIRSSGYAVDVPTSHLGHVIDARGDWHGIGSLPPGLTVDGSLNLHSTNISVLPEGLTVSENLYLSGTSISSLPEGLTVGDSLDLGGTKIRILPEGLTIKGSLNLSSTRISVLPEGLTVGGDLDLSNTNITVLPEGLTVGASLYLYGTNVTVLPDTITDATTIYWEDGWKSAKQFREMHGRSEMSEHRALR